MHRVHHHEAAREQQLMLDLDEIARQGAQKMLAQALQAEVDALTSRPRPSRARRAHGHALVVRNGYHNTRQVVCGALGPSR